jgi:hypothetical protein
VASWVISAWSAGAAGAESFSMDIGSRRLLLEGWGGVQARGRGEIVAVSAAVPAGLGRRGALRASPEAQAVRLRPCSDSDQLP